MTDGVVSAAQRKNQGGLATRYQYRLDETRRRACPRRRAAGTVLPEHQQVCIEGLPTESSHPVRAVVLQPAHRGAVLAERDVEAGLRALQGGLVDPLQQSRRAFGHGQLQWLVLRRGDEHGAEGGFMAYRQVARELEAADARGRAVEMHQHGTNGALTGGLGPQHVSAPSTPAPSWMPAGRV